MNVSALHGVETLIDDTNGEPIMVKENAAEVCEAEPELLTSSITSANGLLMLNENAFVEFWGRVRKMQEGGEGGMKVEVDDEDLAGEGHGDDEREQADLKTLAKSVDVQEIERVLKVSLHI